MKKKISRSRKRLATYREVLRNQGEIQCGICLKPIRFREDLTIDHIIPRAKGGNSRLANLQPAHQKCNTAKADKILHIGA